MHNREHVEAIMDGGDDRGDCDDQQGDNLVEDTVFYLSEKKYPNGCTTRKRQIRNKSERFILKDGELFYNPGKDKQF